MRAPCPVCGTRVDTAAMNAHLDTCLTDEYDRDDMIALPDWRAARTAAAREATAAVPEAAEMAGPGSIKRSRPADVGAAPVPLREFLALSAGLRLRRETVVVVESDDDDPAPPPQSRLLSAAAIFSGECEDSGDEAMLQAALQLSARPADGDAPAAGV